MEEGNWKIADPAVVAEDELRDFSARTRTSWPVRVDGINGDCLESHGLQRRCIEVDLDGTRSTGRQIVERADALLDHAVIGDIEAPDADCHIHRYWIWVVDRRPCVRPPLVKGEPGDGWCDLDAYSGSGSPPEALYLDDSPSEDHHHKCTGESDGNRARPDHARHDGQRPILDGKTTPQAGQDLVATIVIPSVSPTCSGRVCRTRGLAESL